FVYEEGIGSYINNIREVAHKNIYGQVGWARKVKTKLIELFLSAMGHQNCHGGSKFTKGIYIYNHELHRQQNPEYSKLRLHFKKSFIEHLQQFDERELMTTDNTQLLDNVKERKVLLYLTSWSIDENIKDKLHNYIDYVKILKPHPKLNLNDYDNIIKEFDSLIQGRDMIEFLISDMLT